MIRTIISKYRELKKIRYYQKNNPTVWFGTDCKLKNSQYIICGKNISIGENSKLLCWDSYNDIKLEKRPQIVIGDNFKATRNFTIQCINQVIIGKNVLVASDVFIIDYNHGMNPMTPHYLDNVLETKGEGVMIGDGAWIGNNVIILPGVNIGKKAIIGAGSVVTRDIPDYSVAVGNPAKLVKKYDFDKRKWFLMK